MVFGGVFCILFVAVDKKYAAGGIKIKSYWKNRLPETAKKNCKGYYGSPRVLRTLAMTLLNVSK